MDSYNEVLNLMFGIFTDPKVFTRRLKKENKRDKK